MAWSRPDCFRRGWPVAAWMAAIGVSFCLDAPIARWLHAQGIDELIKHSRISHWIKLGGTFYVTLLLGAVMFLLFRQGWRAALVPLFSGVAALGGNLLKWVVGRPRPFKAMEHPGELLALSFHPLGGGLERLFHQTNLAMPSGHACMAFATAAAVGLWLPRQYRAIGYGLAAVVAVQRVLEVAHYLSDVVLGAVVGIALVHAMHRACRRWASWASC